MRLRLEFYCLSFTTCLLVCLCWQMSISFCAHTLKKGNLKQVRFNRLDFLQETGSIVQYLTPRAAVHFSQIEGEGVYRNTEARPLPLNLRRSAGISSKKKKLICQRSLSRCIVRIALWIYCSVLIRVIAAKIVPQFHFHVENSTPDHELKPVIQFQAINCCW